MNTQTIDQIISLVKREVVPATGCTEPVAVALAVSHAASLFSAADRVAESPEIEVLLSANMLKNAMGVGIPGTGMIGLPIAVALGYVLARPEKELSVLDGITSDELAQAKAVTEKKSAIRIALKDGEVDKLYIEVNLRVGSGKSTAVIEQKHTHLTRLSYNGRDLRAAVPANDQTVAGATEIPDLPLNFDLVYEFATTAPLEKIEFILEAARLNKAAGDYSLRGNYGHAVGRMIRGDLGRKYLGDSPLTHMLTYTGAACDARMDGVPVPVMSNSGSGNQGITATLPVYSLALDEGANQEQTVRALMLSNLMVIYIKQKLGRLSALCGCVVAATGSGCGIVYLMGGSKKQIGFAIKNMVGNITGMLCDGAKPGCAMKVSGGVSSAMISALLAMENKSVTSNEGIVDDSVDRTIDNLTDIGREAMQETDRCVLDIMTGKSRVANS